MTAEIIKLTREEYEAWEAGPEGTCRGCWEPNAFCQCDDKEVSVTDENQKQYEVETFSGVFVNTQSPDPATIVIEDIAHALAQTCRYGGHCARFYSVAEHSVLVSRRLEELGHSKGTCLAGLHHDDAEAYLGDIPRPMKPLLGDSYTELTDRMDEAIVAALNFGEVALPHGPSFSFELEVADLRTPVIKEVDNWALFLEARFLLPSKGANWTELCEYWEVDPSLQDSEIDVPHYWLGGQGPETAKLDYLNRHYELIEGGTTCI